jgi:small subunit ribosomal protein S6
MVSDKVVTETGEQLRDYELMVIVSPEIAEEQLEAAIDKIGRFITGKGGTIANTERWGKRKLAYPIKHSLEGNYVLIKCKLKPASSRELEANLQISEEVLRHLLVKLES